MGDWCEQCEGCAEYHPEREMTEVDGDWYCEMCIPEGRRCDECEHVFPEGVLCEYKYGHICKKCAVRMDIPFVAPIAKPKPRRCEKCGKERESRKFIEKLTGEMCEFCAHEYEVSVAGFDDINCKLCDHRSVVA